jgi:hypothetical protein
LGVFGCTTRHGDRLHCCLARSIAIRPPPFHVQAASLPTLEHSPVANTALPTLTLNQLSERREIYDSAGSNSDLPCRSGLVIVNVCRQPGWETDNHTDNPPKSTPDTILAIPGVVLCETARWCGHDQTAWNRVRSCGGSCLPFVEGRVSRGGRGT